MITQTKAEYSADILVVGGGMAAVLAAMRAVENGASVLLVDKGSIGRSGQTPFASAMGLFDEDNGDDRDNWHRMMAENAYNLNNPAYLDNFMDYSKDIYSELVSWGATDIGFGKVFRSKIMETSGIEVLERTMITNLLEENGKVLGAVGFKLDQEEAVVIKSKSVILCTGAGGFKPSGFQICSLTFDGDAMAYRIGARIAGKEFVDTHYTLADEPANCWGQWEGMWRQGLPKIENPLIDGGGQALDLSGCHSVHADGVSVSSEEDSMERPSGPPPGETNGEDGSDGPPSDSADAEGQAGGPPSGGQSGDEQAGGPPSDGQSGDEQAGGPPADGQSEDGERPGRSRSSQIGGASCGLSVHKAEGLFPTNNKCATDIEGLYAAGDCLSSMLVGPIYNGVAGFSMMGSATQGALAGEVSAEYVKTSSMPSISDSKIDAVVEEMFQPLNNEQGYSPGWVEHMLQGTLIPYYVLYIKHEERLKAALTNIEFYRDHFAGSLLASDLHDLRKAHEVRNMILNAEMKLRASLFRTESRGNHYREDYPDSDENQWLAWVTLQKGSDDTMQLGKFMIEDFEKLVV